MEQVIQGKPPGDLSLDDILDNITLYWLTNTGISSARLYWENKDPSSTPRTSRSRLPSASSPTSSIEHPGAGPSRHTHNLIHYNRLDRGGHFAAWEQPQLFSEEMRASFKTLR